MAVEIILDDEIGPAYWGLLDARWLRDQVKAASGGDILLRINSPGGSVIEAQAMYSELRQAQERGQKVTVQIDALAASAASFLAMVGDQITIAENAMIMIHKAWTIAMGNADDMQQTADVLRKFDGVLVDQYAARTGKDKQQIADWMAAETWMTAQDAIDNGFADSISTLNKAKPVSASVMPGRFKNTPKTLEGWPSAQTLAARENTRKLAIARAHSSVCGRSA
jgi:ATP-dependent Clp protease protease subunit